MLIVMKTKKYFFKMKPLITAMLAQLKKKDVATIPDALAFNFMMALLPLLIVIFQILTFLSIESGTFDHMLMNYLPAEVHEFLMYFLADANIEFSRNPILVIIALLTLSLTLSRGIHGIFKAFAITYEQDRLMTSGIKYRLKSIALLLLFLLFIGASALLMTSSHRWLTTFHPMLRRFLELAIFSCLCTLFFLLLFLLGGHKKRHVTDILPGTLLTTTCFIVISITFTFYANRLANFHLVYGSLAVIIILLMWLFLLGHAINLGIQLNYVLDKEDAEGE